MFSGIFLESSPNERKVILSTTIAESSVTIPDIVYVVDFCLTKQLEVQEDSVIFEGRQWSSISDPFNFDMNPDPLIRKINWSGSDPLIGT